MKYNKTKTGFRLDWRGDQVLAEVKQVTEDELHRVAVDTSEMAKQIVHVVTGRLKRSIRAVRTSQGWEVGGYTPYALAEETRPGHSYIWPAFEMVRTRYWHKLLRGELSRQVDLE